MQHTPCLLIVFIVLSYLCLYHLIPTLAPLSFHKELPYRSYLHNVGMYSSSLSLTLLLPPLPYHFLILILPPIIPCCYPGPHKAINFTFIIILSLFYCSQPFYLIFFCSSHNLLLPLFSLYLGSHEFTFPTLFLISSSCPIFPHHQELFVFHQLK